MIDQLKPLQAQKPKFVELIKDEEVNAVEGMAGSSGIRDRLGCDTWDCNIAFLIKPISLAIDKGYLGIHPD